MPRILIVLIGIICLLACKPKKEKDVAPADVKQSSFHIEQTDNEIRIVPDGGNAAVVTQNTKPNFRPYIHPILAPGSNTELTEYSPGHHKHQTGLYWGFTRINGTGAEPGELKEWFYNPDKPRHIQKKLAGIIFTILMGATGKEKQQKF